MGREEQLEEVEILRSIYPEEIQGKMYMFHSSVRYTDCTDVSDTEYRITIALDVPDEEDDTSGPR